MHNPPEGIYTLHRVQLAPHFATTTRRRVLLERLLHLYTLAEATGFQERFVVFGSFVTTKPEPGDLDIILVMRMGFQSSQALQESQLLFDHERADTEFGASVFWVRIEVLP
ncbi:MAG: hypothetical protein NTX57_01825 [Armatimonadetes bacterium]|nr:hypothetical protein [Armatimonadota bacterium]